MNAEYKRKAPWIRLASVIAALSITLSIGGFIDLLAFSYVADAGHASQALQPYWRAVNQIQPNLREKWMSLSHLVKPMPFLG